MPFKLKVHAGNLKTGSTSIQAFLRRNLGALNSSGVVYIPSLEHNPAAHASLARALGAEPGVSDRPTWDGMISEVAANAPAGAEILLTNEIFIRARADRLKQQLNQIGVSDCTIYFYLRPHVEMIVSSYLQEIKTGFFRVPLDRCFDGIAQRREIDFCTSIDDFSETFGRNQVHCREFERRHFPGGDVVNDISSFFGLPILSQPSLVRPENMANVSPGAEAAALLLHVRQFLPVTIQLQDFWLVRDRVFGPLNVALERALGRQYRTSFRMPVALQERTKEMFEAGRLEFAKRYEMSPLSDRWMNEPIVSPERPKQPPLDLVQTAFAQVIDRLEARHQSAYLPLMTRVINTLPTSTDGGVPVVDLDGLRPRVKQAA